MASLPRLKEKIASLAGRIRRRPKEPKSAAENTAEKEPKSRIGIKTALAGFFGRVKELAAQFKGQMQLGVERLLEKVPPHRRRMVVIACGVSFAALLLVIVGVSVATMDRSRKPVISSAGNTGSGHTESSGNAVPQRVTIPPDELFLPFEPDFVPGVMLERQQRTAWTAEDAAPFWQDPLKNGEQEWRDSIEKTIDDIMESVP